MAKLRQNSNLTPDSRKRLAYRLREVSEMTGIPVSTLRTMVRRGEINPVTSFGTWLITAEELEALLQKRLRNTRPIKCGPGILNVADHGGAKDTGFDL